jgi:SagB-type dehydrogenase family enzyme
VHSASNLYPIEVYVIPNMVSGASCGIYHYEPDEHKLVLVREGSFTEDVQKAAYGKTYAGDASAAIVLTAVPGRVSKKYGDQGADRYINIEAGGIAQNIMLEAAAIDIGASHVDSFSQDFVDLTIGIDGYKEKSVYMTLIGKKKK